MDKNISFTLKVWRQAGPKAKGAFETYQMKDIPGDTSFLEMLDILNEQLINERKEPVVFTSTDTRTVLQQVLLLAKSICVVSTTVIPSLLNLGVRLVSLSSKT